jgi:hypothetical protein
MDADDSVIEPDWRRFVDPAIVLELIPIIALVSAYGLAALVELLTNGQARGSQLVPAFVLALGFFVSGLGWFRVGEPGYGRCSQDGL